METTSTADKIKAIKCSFRSYMDGVIAASLREKGSPYKVIWGISHRHLREIAAEYTPDCELATGLWQNDIRECKLLAVMLIPVNSVDMETVKSFIDGVDSEELAEMLVFETLQKLRFGPALAKEMLSAEKDLTRLMAINLYARLFMRRYIPDEMTQKKFMSVALDALNSDKPVLRRAALNTIFRFSALGEQQNVTARAATQAQGFDFL